MPTTSVSGWTFEQLRAAVDHDPDSIRISLCDTMSSVEYRVSIGGLNTWTRWRAIWRGAAGE